MFTDEWVLDKNLLLLNFRFLQARFTIQHLEPYDLDSDALGQEYTILVMISFFYEHVPLVARIARHKEKIRRLTN